MKVTLIDNFITRNFILPAEVVGNFWITDFDEEGNTRNLINIEADDGKWMLRSNDDVYCIVNGKRALAIMLKNYNFCVIKNTLTNQYLLIYSSPLVDGTLTYYECRMEQLAAGISIGKNANNNIIYNIQLLEDVHAKIQMDAQKNVVIKDHDETFNKNGNRYGIYVNGERILKPKVLNNGNIIFILGLKIVFLKRNSRYFFVINNPNNVIHVNSLYINTDYQDVSVNYEEEKDDVKFELYEEKDYYYKNPRFIYEIKPVEITIDNPPAKQEENKTPAILTLGPTLTMSLSSLATTFIAITNSINSGASFAQMLPSFIMCGTMLASSLMWPSFTRKYEKEKAKENEEERKNKYSQYIDGLKAKIFNEMNNQKAILKNGNPTLQECYNIITNKYTNLWERRISDSDFLKISLGNGTIPMSIGMNYSSENFSMVEDELKQMAKDLYEAPKNLNDVPVTFSFKDNSITGIIGTEQMADVIIKNVLLQLMAFHCYDSLKIVIFTSNDKANKWEFMKYSPYCWSSNKKVRFFSSNSEDAKEVCYNLNKIYMANKGTDSENNKKDKLEETYLIITDAFKTIRNFDIIKDLLEDKEYHGFSLAILTEKITSLPDDCNKFVRINNDGTGEIFSSYENDEKQKFNIDLNYNFDISKITRVLANTPVELENNEEGRLPDKLSFLEMYDVGRIEQLNILNRWINNVPILNIGVPVGIGKNGEKINLDLHEKYHGPHGLVAGMTGSGKSEFIITYILSLAVNYHPYEVQFIIIDYKGGGLALAFKNETLKIALPHLVGTITNLDVNELNRTFASVESELKRRQKLFNEAREITKESTIDIYKYQRLYREGRLKEPVSHLFIIVDEFAELKSQQPDFMDQLVSTARIGRSLGVHLILATQKPSGVVDSQIWSNTRFRVCMRVQETEDSNEVIKCPDAAYLTKTGRFYMQVGYNEIFTLGQSAWSGAKYYATEKIKKEVDSSIEFINNVGYSIKNVDTRENTQTEEVAKGEELTCILQYLSDLAKQENIIARPLWKEKIPEKIHIEELKEKYHFVKQPFNLNPIIGEYDVPQNQEQYLLTLPLTKEGNVLLYGASGSGKENLLSTLIYSSELYYTPEEVNYYILDFGTEVLKYFAKSPFVGGVVTALEEDRIVNLFKFVYTTISKRKEELAEYNGDFLLYNQKSPNKAPNIVVIINNYDTFNELYPNIEEQLVPMTRDCAKYGIYFIITTNNPTGIKYRLKQNFSQTICLQLNDDDDYSYIFGNNKLHPSRLFGRGLIEREGINEFQTALIGEVEDIPNLVNQLNTKLLDHYSIRAPKINVLPEFITYADVEEAFNNPEEIIVGIEKQSLEISKYNYTKDLISIITASDDECLFDFTNIIVKQLQEFPSNMVTILNSNDEVSFDDFNERVKCYNDSFDEVLLELKNQLDNKEQSATRNIYVIYGLNNIGNRLSDENQTLFDECMQQIANNKNNSYIFIGDITSIRTYESEQWFKKNSNLSNGIWIGYGLDDQYTLKVIKRTEEMRNPIEQDYCFVLKKGKPVLVKLINDFDKSEETL